MHVAFSTPSDLTFHRRVQDFQASSTFVCPLSLPILIRNLLSALCFSPAMSGNRSLKSPSYSIRTCANRHSHGCCNQHTHARMKGICHAVNWEQSPDYYSRSQKLRSNTPTHKISTGLVLHSYRVLHALILMGSCRYGYV